MSLSINKTMMTFVGVGFVLLLSSCNQSQPIKAGEATNVKSTEDLYIVDCLLPGQVRSLGNTNYIAARRPIRTTAVDCSIRGGEYVSYDRADYRTALKVWLAKAEEGDPEAQNYVGEIFEKGLGQQPDYVSAMNWYRKAAKQNYSRAQINMGYMYEQGLGVEKNIVTALNLYRQASGKTDDALILNSTAQAELDKVRKQLSKKVSTANMQAQVLEKQLLSTQQYIEKASKLSVADAQATARLSDAEEEIVVLRELYARAQEEKQGLQDEIAQLDKTYRQVETTEILKPESQKLAGSSPQVLGDINFGRYYAMIIGNQDYQYFDDLRSPMRDAIRLKEILETKYGFSSVLLSNADEKDVLNTINDLYGQIGPKDNLLIYYAGHGNVQKSSNSNRKRGYWLPVDASPDNINNWLSNSIISDHLDRLRARSILVVADSCYAGSLGSETSAFLFGSNVGNLTSASIKAGMSRKSRIVISSGGVKPVLDGTNVTHSVFASSLIDVLENNQQALRDSMLFSQLSVNVRRRNEKIAESAVPEMKPVRTAGHEGGSFFFIPTSPAG